MPPSSSSSSLPGASTPRLPLLRCDLLTSELLSCAFALITDHKKSFRAFGEGVHIHSDLGKDIHLEDSEMHCEMDTIS